MVDSKEVPEGKAVTPEASAAPEDPEDSSPTNGDATATTPSAPKHKPLSEEETRLMAEIQNGEKDAVVSLLGAGANVNCLDAHGMTPLMQAAHKASPDLCELLLNHGADVNSNFHDYAYTALMFAAITGNLQTTEILLANGAKPLVKNSVGRNAGQMAAFVGQHHIASFINNFIPKEEVEFYTVPQGLEAEAELPLECLQPFHRLILSQNVNPAKIALFVQKNPVLMENRLKVVRLLEKLCAKWFKATNPTMHNEARAIKMSYLACCLREMGKSHVEKSDNGTAFVKFLLKARDSDMFPIGQEKFIRQTLREFPYLESESLQGMIHTLSKTQMGHKPTALEVLNTSINGPALPNQDDRICETCGGVGAEKRCAACKMVSYCDGTCQKTQWFTHKKFCKDLQEQFKKIESAAAADQHQHSGDGGCCGGGGGHSHSHHQRPQVDADDIMKDLKNMKVGGL